jgi:crotonobetainyl-CoA:carnitine CoA-transferase CaiB-like acyl-CoA transferase
MPEGSPLLSGVRILDLTNVLAGPFASYQLGLLGAEVIKVESPHGGDLARQLGASAERNRQHMGASFVAQNGGKRSITVDLKTNAGREVFTRLVARADALVENFRPGVLERLGFGPDVLHRIRPDLVYCAVSGFGATGPLRDRPAYDQIIQGLSGMMAATGTAQTGPLRSGFPIADTLGGITAALAVAAALFRRERTGEGATIDVSMLETAMTAMGWVVSNYLVAGQEPTPLGNENFTASPSGTFRTGDGLLNIAANRQSQFETLCRLLGMDALVDDERFRHREARLRYRDQLHDLVEDALAAHGSAHWEGVLSDAGIPAGRVLSVAEAIGHEQLCARGLVHRLPSGKPGDTVSVLGNGIHVDGDSSVPRSGPPLLGAHTDEILAEIGFSDADIGRLRTEGGV